MTPTTSDEIEFDPEIDGRDGKQQADPETKRLVDAGFSDMAKILSRHVKDGKYGRVSLHFDLRGGQVTDQELIDKTTRKRRPPRDSSENGVDASADSE